MNFTYLAVNLAAVLVPFIFSFHPKIRFDKNFIYFAKSNFVVSILFIAWDIIFTDWKVWSFNPNYLTRLYIFNLPVEEVLFFIFIPFACVFTYHCIIKLYLKDRVIPAESTITPALILLLLLFGTIFIDRLYTSFTFILLAAALFCLKYILKVKWLGGFYLVYSVLIIPFFIVNGILTGTGPDAPVVSYNNTENMGIRLLTIPVEDIFYGMLLILLNVSLYRFLKHRNNESIVAAGK
jgi:lycopene cyclase domain-containing protein